MYMCGIWTCFMFEASPQLVTRQLTLMLGEFIFQNSLAFLKCVTFEMFKMRQILILVLRLSSCTTITICSFSEMSWPLSGADSLTYMKKD